MLLNLMISVGYNLSGTITLWSKTNMQLKINIADTSVSSIIINNIFSADYDIYKIVYCIFNKFDTSARPCKFTGRMQVLYALVIRRGILSQLQDYH